MWIRGTPGVDWPLCPECGQGDELLIILLPDETLQIHCEACGWRDRLDADRPLRRYRPPGLQARVH